MKSNEKTKTLKLGEKITIKKEEIDTHELSYLFKYMHPEIKKKTDYIIVEQLRGAILYTAHLKE